MSGHNHELVYKKHPPKDKENRTRKRKIIWFNPPFDTKVKTNVAKRFLAAIESSFPKEHILNKIFNKNTIKVSYSCMANIKTIIDCHNKKQMANTNIDKRPCNCRDKSKCPLQGDCRQSSVVYQATVRTSSPENTETYVGLTDTEFKIRLANHKQSFEKEKLRNATELSKHIWKLREKNTEYELSWKILGRAKAYNNISKSCSLCILEKFYILRHPKEASLNQKCGLISSCRHASRFTLENHPT